MREITNMLEEKILRVKELGWRFELSDQTTQFTEVEMRNKVRIISRTIDSMALEKECDMIILIESKREPFVVNLLKKHEVLTKSRDE